MQVISQIAIFGTCSGSMGAEPVPESAPLLLSLVAAASHCSGF